MYSTGSAGVSEETSKPQLDQAVTASWARYGALYRNPVLMGLVLFVIICAVVMLAPMTSYRFLYGDF